MLLNGKVKELKGTGRSLGSLVAALSSAMDASSSGDCVFVRVVRGRGLSASRGLGASLGAAASSMARSPGAAAREQGRR